MSPLTPYVIPLVAFCAAATAASCSNDDDLVDSPLVGTYALAAVNVDPGDGSGTLQPVDSDRRLRLFPEGLATSGEDLCQISGGGDFATQATYSLEDSLIRVPQCGSSPIAFSLRGDHLLLTYRCFEPCEALYRRVGE